MASRLQLSQQSVECLQLTTVVLYEPQVRELGPHVTLDAMETAGKRGELSREHRGEHGLLVAQRGRRMAAVHGDRRSLHRGNRECKPVNNVTEQLQSLLNTVDGVSHRATLKPVVVLVLPLREQTAAVARSAPLALRAQGGR